MISSADTPVRVVVAEPHPGIRRGLAAILDMEKPFRVVAEVADGLAALEAAEDADVVILDTVLPPQSGLEAARQIAREWPRTRTLLLSMHEHEQYFWSAVAAGAVGYVVKGRADQEIIRACWSASRGEPFVHLSTVAAISRRARQGRESDAFSDRELATLTLIADGKTTEEIAQALSTLPTVVERFRVSISGKLGLRMLPLPPSRQSAPLTASHVGVG